MKGAGFIVFLILVSVPASTNDALWSYHKRQLHQRLEARDFYAAKQELAQLRNLDPDTYRARGFAATEAWIAVQQGHWDSAYRHNRTVASWTEDTTLEMAQCLERMGRFREAIAHLNLPGIKFRGESQWEAQSLQARCLSALSKTDEAMVFFEKLANSNAPPYYRIPALQALIEVYYKSGRFQKARSIAERIQEKSPGSDAALSSVVIQEQQESQDYLERHETWLRFAEVCYKNRDFQRSDKYYQRIKTELSGLESQRATYFMALTWLKKGKPEDARAAFLAAVAKLKGSRFEGPAAFQYARSLYLSGLDRETIDYVNQYRREGTDPKWQAECLRLTILSLRHMGDQEGLRALGEQLEKQGGPAWLNHFYYRNAIAWEVHNGSPSLAMDHLNRYRRYEMKPYEQQEATLWEGLVYWKQGHYEESLERWLSLVEKDPNHFFGLVARQLITDANHFTQTWEKEWARVSEKLETQPLATLRRLYYLAPDQSARSRLVPYLKASLPKTEWLQEYPNPVFGQDVLELAEIGRFDRAARQLSGNNQHKMEYHYLEASWNMKAGLMFDSIRHAEILASSWPRWVPYELLPAQVQHLIFPEGFANIVFEKAGAYKVDPYLLLAIIREESKFNTHAKSWASARGLMQFIPSTAQETASQIEGLEAFDLPMLYDPNTAITLGAKYVDNLMASFGGVSLYTIAAYNAGEGAVRRWSDMDDDQGSLRFVWDVTYDETKFYCQKVLRAYHHYSRVYREGEENTIILAPRLKDTRGLQLDTLALPH